MSAKKTATTQPEQTKKTSGSQGTTSAADGPFTLGGQEWTAQEVAQIRAELTEEIDRLDTELEQAQDHLDQLRDSSQGASGEDAVDTGTQAYERENELAIVSHATGTIDQIQAALARLDDGTYGTCENCGKSIGKERLQAFPKATMCIDCKKLQERR